MMAGVPPDLFERLAWLDRVCEVQLSSTYSGQSRTGWKVRIVRRDSPGTLPIVTIGSRLREVLEESLAKADALGWFDTQ